MSRLLAILGSTIGGYAGWVLGEPFGIFPAFILGIIGTALGVYAARRITSHYGL